MPISITEDSRQFLEKLIQDKFHSIDFSMEYIYGEAEKLIKITKDLGMYHLAEELEELSKVK